jgi:arylsulfatase A
VKTTLRFFFVLAVCSGIAFTAAAAEAAAKPNIIFILSDDVGLGNIGCYGGAFKTPNIDALAAGGTRFEHCFANPLCGPSRATCLTGRYLFRTNMLTNGYTNAMNRNEIMVPKVLKPAGYVTAAVGKWSQLPLQPSDWGFDEYLRFQGSGKYWSSQEKNYTQNGKTIELGDRYLPDVMHDFLVDFITRHKDQPFYVHYAMSHMHAKMMGTPETTTGRKGDLYAENNAYMDKLVGRLVSALDKLGLREKTLLIFTGDNGTARGAAAEATVEDKAISGKKGDLLEGGSLVPLIFNWPGTTPAGKVLKDLTDFTDFLPTFAELGGAKLPEGVTVDGHSCAPQIKGEKGTPREWIFMQLGQEWYVRDADWKLTGTGALFDMSGAPFVEKPVANDTTDEAAKGARSRLQGVLDQLNPSGGKVLSNSDTKEARKERRRKKKAQEAANGAGVMSPGAVK